MAAVPRPSWSGPGRTIRLAGSGQRVGGAGAADPRARDRRSLADHRALAIHEAVVRSTGGYAACSIRRRPQIEIAYAAPDAVVVHELAHAWFNGHLVGRSVGGGGVRVVLRRSRDQRARHPAVVAVAAGRPRRLRSAECVGTEWDMPAAPRGVGLHRLPGLRTARRGARRAGCAARRLVRRGPWDRWVSTESRRSRARIDAARLARPARSPRNRTGASFHGPVA